MRAMRIHQIGETLRLETVPTPTPGPGEVLLRVLACGVNFADTLAVAGKYQERPEPPFAPGLEVCGLVEAHGPGVDDGPAQGARVMATTGFGGLADYVVAPAAACVPAPEALDAAEVAAVPVAYGTAHVGLHHRARIRPRERLVVLGAAGGVGLCAVEVGKLMGAEVVACARGPERLAVAQSKGADHLIDTLDGPEALRERVLGLGGSDVVFDPVGGDLWRAALRSAKPEARLLPIGFASGQVPQIPANILLVKNLDVIGLYWGAYQRFAPQVLGDSFATLAAWLGERRLVPHVSHRLPLEEAETALDLLRNRQATGKVVIETA